VSTTHGVNESPRAAALAASVLDEVERVVIGKRPVLELVLMALLSDGHVLIEDLPGLAKTLMARSFAEVIKLRFGRIQFTPDLMPSDVTGAAIYDQRNTEFIFRPGPVFVNLLLGDEINRAPAKTQSALLEAMQERQVTVEGTTRQLERPFLVIATQNPIEAEGTYPLPEAQLDRFLVRISVGHPEREHEIEILRRRAARCTDEVELKEVLDPATLRWLQNVTEAVYVSPAILAYIVDLVSATRSSPLVQVGASPRGSLALMKLARSRATLAGRDFVIPEDVKAVAVPALAHRIMLKPEVWVQRLRTDDLVRRVLETVPTPSADEAELQRS
jgi:MoxR-like ATPase